MRPAYFALLVFAAASCREPVAPARPPYLAIVSQFIAAPEHLGVRFAIEELSGTLGIQRTVSALPGDTLILPLPPASYIVEILDLPPNCSVREGSKRLITLLDTDNTGMLRYNVTCLSSLRLEVIVDGYEIDPELVYHVTGAGTERLGIVNLSGSDSMHTRADTIVLDGLPGGEFQVSLSHVADNCQLYGDNVAGQRTLAIPASGGGEVSFRLRCSERAVRPQILSMASTYHDNTSGFVFRVADPDRDVRSYRWDLTDCRGTSVLPDGMARVRRGLDGGRTLRADTMLIVGAFEAGVPDTALAGRCTAIMVEDYRGNISQLVEQRILAFRGGSPPRSSTFNVRLIGTTSIATALTAEDSDGDFAGSFAAVRVRDGVLAAFDGNPDIGILSAAGFLDTVIPAISLGTRLRWDDVYAVIVYLIDHAGNFRRLEDADLAR